MRHRPRTRSAALVAVAVLTTACTGAEVGTDRAPTSASSTASPAAPLALPTPTSSPTRTHAGSRGGAAVPAGAPDAAPTGATTSPDSVDPDVTPVRLHVESRAADVTTDAFATEVAHILRDPRGWEQAGFNFLLEGAEPAPYLLVLAEAAEVDELCLPLDTDGTYSCQNGPVVALNADRWRTATPSWTGTLADYRRMLVNHEVGHLLHLHHPLPQCSGIGLPAPVMAQQSSGTGLCTENPWPLRWEIELAARNAEPLAPPATHDTRDHQPSPPPATE